MIDYEQHAREIAAQLVEQEFAVEPDGAVSRRSVVAGVLQDANVQGREARNQASRNIMEGFAYLARKGVIARAPLEEQDRWFLTRAGRQLIRPNVSAMRDELQMFEKYAD